MTTSISRSDLELLSAYLDGELTPSERAALESRLAAESELRETLDGLRLTVWTLQAAPVLQPPRSFVLDPARFRRRAPWWAQYGAYRLAGVLGAAASVALIALGVILSGMPGAPIAPADSLQEVAMDATSATGAAPRLSALVTPTIAPMTEAAQMFAGDVAETPEAVATVAALALPTMARTPTQQPEPAAAAAELGMDMAQESVPAPPAALSAPGAAAPTAIKTLDIGSLRALPTSTVLPSATPSTTPSPTPTASPTPPPTFVPTAVALQAESTTAVVAAEPEAPSLGIASRVLLVVGLMMLIVSVGVLSLDILRKRL
jgi:anti-sigma factor RsiW